MRITYGLLLAVFVSITGACGDDDDDEPTPDAPTGNGPYDQIPTDKTVTAAGLSAPVDVVRDQYGVPHIYAQSIEDAAFANGYVQATDRFQQMDIFRHFAAARVAELFGSLSPGQIDGDLRMRMHRMQPLAEQAWAELQASTDPIDQDIVKYFNRYADGVNQYIAELKAGEHVPDPAVGIFLNPDTVEPWTPANSLAIGRLQAWALAYDDSDLRITNVLDRSLERFDGADAVMQPDHARRAGAFFDLFRNEPMDETSTIDGFPNETTDTGSRAKPSARSAPRRPLAPAELIAQARQALKPPTVLGNRITSPQDGSNNWVVGPSMAGDGTTMLANDPHLSLMNPPIWWLVHITVPGVMDVEGVSFSGIPGVILGHNEHVAWGATVVAHDVTDLYLETIVPCSAGGGDCVIFEGGEVAIETWTETVKVGALGFPNEEKTVTYEYVPHHGPIIPIVDNHDVVPRTSNQAISVRFTGYAVTNEVKAFFGYLRAANIDEAYDAAASFRYGAQNFVFADDSGNIGWTTRAHVPLREATCFSFSPDNTAGVAPFLLLPGEGGCEWEGELDRRYIPHAKNPEKGYLATANQDPVGATFDGDPLNQTVVDGRPLYLGTFYDSGFRVGRITRRLEEVKASGQSATLDDMRSIQGDTYSNYGDRLNPVLGDAIARLEAGTDPNLLAWSATLSQAQRDRITAAGSYLAGWTYATPAAADGSATADQISDSVATTIFNVWAVYFLSAAFGDELAVVEDWVDEQTTTRLSLAVFERPETLRSGIAVETGEPILCDDLDTVGSIESCRLIALMALDQALAWAQGALGGDMDQWRWGNLHTVRFSTLTGQPELDLPAQGQGYPRHGDSHAVDVSNHGLDDTNFTYGHGPSMRHLTRFEPGQPPQTLMAIPGGQTFNRESPHFSDLGETYWIKNEYFALPFTTAEIIDKHESKWQLVP